MSSGDPLSLAASFGRNGVPGLGERPGWDAETARRYVEVARAAAQRDGAALVEALDSLGDPPEAISGHLLRHHVLPTVLATLRESESIWAPRLAEPLEGLEPRVRNWSQGVLACFAEVQSALEAAGIPLLVLKGPVLGARLYGAVERRPQGDLDLLVRRGQRRDAERVLYSLGYRRSRRDQHAARLGRGDSRIDLHWALRSAPAYRLDEVLIWQATPEVEVAGVMARSLSDEYLLALLAIGLAEDAGIGMVKLKQLVDLWLLARELDARQNWRGWLDRRARERVEGVAAAGLWLMLTAADVEGELPGLREALAMRRGVPGPGSDRLRALALLGAPRHDPASRRWFAAAYPGSLTALRLHSLLTGLPHSLRESRPVRQVARAH